MFRALHARPGHYLLLILATAVLFLPNLGRASLWDIDEGNNAEAAREMLVSGNWVVPTFNYQLRPDKPVLLYWLQIAGYLILGVNEWAVRLPSALAAVAAVILTYELARALFGPATGLQAGIVLASSLMFSAAAHFANPDALLTGCSTLALLLFWHSLSCPSAAWVVSAGAAAGLAVLAKGPVGLLLPGAVAFVFLAWTRRWRWLLAGRVLGGLLTCAAVALPWYAWVGAETHGDFLRGFLLNHNAGRYLQSMEGHHGGMAYYPAVLVIGLVPWSPFLGLAAWYGTVGREPENAGMVVSGRDRYRFLWCWVGVYLVFFSLAATKLPNYILPLYPAAAVLVGRFLDRWSRGLAVPAPAAVLGALLGLALVGVVVVLGLLVAGGMIEVPALRGRAFPGVRATAALGFVPIIGSGLAGWFVGRRQVGHIAPCLSMTAILFVGLLAACGIATLDAYKAPQALAGAYRVARSEPEIRLACLDYDQPSLVFYCRRGIQRLAGPADAAELLRYPIPVYLFASERAWNALQPLAPRSVRLLARRYDLYRGCEIMLVTNR